MGWLYSAPPPPRSLCINPWRLYPFQASKRHLKLTRAVRVADLVLFPLVAFLRLDTTLLHTCQLAFAFPSPISSYCCSELSHLISPRYRTMISGRSQIFLLISRSK